MSLQLCLLTYPLSHLSPLSTHYISRIFAYAAPVRSIVQSPQQEWPRHGLVADSSEGQLLPLRREETHAAAQCPAMTMMWSTPHTHHQLYNNELLVWRSYHGRAGLCQGRHPQLSLLQHTLNRYTLLLPPPPAMSRNPGFASSLQTVLCCSVRARRCPPAARRARWRT